MTIRLGPLPTPLHLTAFPIQYYSDSNVRPCVPTCDFIVISKPDVTLMGFEGPNGHSPRVTGRYLLLFSVARILAVE